MPRILLAALLLPLLHACSEEAPEMPMVEVITDEVASEPYQPEQEFVGRLEAIDDVAIQAKITGYVLSRDFREGELVEAGDVLYVLDSSEYDAALARAEAGLAAAVANQANAERKRPSIVIRLRVMIALMHGGDVSLLYFEGGDCGECCVDKEFLICRNARSLHRILLNRGLLA